MAKATAPIQEDEFELFVETNDFDQSVSQFRETQDHPMGTDTSKKRKVPHFEEQHREFTMFYLSSTEEFRNNSTVAGIKAESQDSKNDQGSYHVSVAPGDLHWPPVLTPSDFYTPAIVQTSDRTDHTDHSIGYRELTDIANSHLQRETNSFTGISTSAAGPTRTATPTLLPSLQSLPAPALYQCSSCGQLNPIAPFPPKESGDSSSYSLPTLAENSDFQDEMENRWKRQKRNY